MFVIVLIVIGASGAGRIDMDKFNGPDLAALAALAVSFCLISWWAPRLLGLNRPDSTAINIEVTMRNGNLGLLIKASLFPAVVGVADPVGDMVLFTVLLYGGLAIPLSAALIYIHGRKNRALQSPGAASNSSSP